MKTSFYFVCWILIYPILGLLNIDFINNNSFLVAILCILGLSWLLKRAMPNVLLYDKATAVLPVLEDIFTGNIASFKKRIKQEMLIEIVGSLYLITMTAIIGYSWLKTGEAEVFTLIIFALISLSGIVRSVKLNNAFLKIKANPTPDECIAVAATTYQLDYSPYYEQRKELTFAEMFPPRPKAYKAFSISSIVLAILSIIFGVIFIGTGVYYLILGLRIAAEFASHYGPVLALSGMYLLYGSLAFYYGIKDLITSVRTNNRP